ncbi:MAG: sigma-70 family RNA polymerase sigma factor [Cellvibrio sp.]|uniref:sigma-70 family RNA polymerase sigma factor n=1 Tax=Cellvibrio sp. TaxID=1965322 RepID=UPI0031AA5371
MSNQTSHPLIETLYRDHYAWLRSWLSRRLACRHTAGDLSQDVFVRLLGRGDSAQIQDPRAYLARVAHGLVIDRHRRQRVEAACLEALASSPEAVMISPEEQLIMIDSLTRIDALLDQLKPRARQIFLMSRLEGMSYDEISAQLNVSRSTVQKDLALALRHCYQVLMGGL